MTTTDRDVMQQALEALEAVVAGPHTAQSLTARDALRAALAAQPVTQDPVVVVFSPDGGHGFDGPHEFVMEQATAKVRVLKA